MFSHSKGKQLLGVSQNKFWFYYTILKTKIPTSTIRINQNQDHIPPTLLKGKDFIDSTSVILNTMNESQNQSFRSKVKKEKKKLYNH